MRSRRATAYPAPRRYHITRCDPYDSDSFVTSPHESCALAAPRWVPVRPVRSHGCMPALEAVNGS